MGSSLNWLEKRIRGSKGSSDFKPFGSNDVNTRAFSVFILQSLQKYVLIKVGFKDQGIISIYLFLKLFHSNP